MYIDASRLINEWKPETKNPKRIEINGSIDSFTIIEVSEANDRIPLSDGEQVLLLDRHFVVLRDFRLNNRAEDVFRRVEYCFDGRHSSFKFFGKIILTL